MRSKISKRAESISQPLGNHRYDVITDDLDPWALQLRAFVPSGDAGYHAYSGAAPVPCVQGIRESC